MLHLFTFSTLFLGAAALVSAQVPAFVQGNVVFFNPKRGGDDALPKVQAALNLSEAQVNAVKVLLNMRAETTSQIGRDMAAAQTKLQELASQSNPNPTEVGNAFLATQNVETRFRAAAEKFQTDFQALLSAEQRSILTNLQAASAQIESLRALGVIDAPLGAIPMPFTKFAPVGGVAAEGVRIIERARPIR
jgi:hypothetical protein